MVYMSEWKHPGDDEFLTDNEKRTDKPANDEERTLALAAHASPILAMIVSACLLYTSDAADDIALV